MHDKRLILYTVAACWWPEVAKKGRIVQLKMKWHNKTGFVPHSHINESRNVGFRVKIESTNNDTFRLLVGKCNDNTPSTPGARKFCQLANNISTRDLNLIFFCSLTLERVALSIFVQQIVSGTFEAGAKPFYFAYFI